MYAKDVEIPYHCFNERFSFVIQLSTRFHNLFIVKKEAHVVFLFKFVIQRYICIIGQFTILLQI